MESKQRHLIALTVLFAVIGVGLLVTAFATDYWVSASPFNNLPKGNNDTDPDINTGNSSFGLFNGHQILKYTTGPRSFPLEAVCNASESVCAYIFMRSGGTARQKLTDLIETYKNVSRNSSATTGQAKINYGLFSFPIWVSTIVFLSLSIVMGLVTIGFTVFNVFGRPIETITGPMGLYLWNFFSLILTVVTLALFGALYNTQLSSNFLMYDDYNTGWRSNRATNLDWSFFLVVGAAGAFIINFILLFLSGQSISCSYAGSAEKEVDNGMILY